MSQWRLNDDDFEDDDDYSKTNVEKKADAPWTQWSQGHFKVAIEYYCSLYVFFKPVENWKFATKTLNRVKTTRFFLIGK